MAVVWRNVPHRLRQERGVDLLDTMSARRHTTRNVRSNICDQPHLQRTMAGTRRQLGVIIHSAQVSQQLIEPCGVDRVLRSLCDQTTM